MALHDFSLLMSA